MPLLGKIVVIKRNGTDGTEFPLTASCLFGRKIDCDIRIQLPQVSKEHCRIEFNENKELILTNLSSVNPTRINGDILQQSGRLKHGDLITIIDRSFRFEYPPAPTPKKKRLSTPGKGETITVLQDQQVTSTPGTTAKNKSEIATDTCLKDGFNLPICQDQSAADQENKASMDSISSPFSDLYNMVKRDLATKPVWKPASLSNTPCSRPSVDKQGVENVKPVTPKSTQKKRRSSASKPFDGGQTENLTLVKTATPAVQREQKRRSAGVNTPLSQKKTPPTTPQKFTADQVAQQIALESPGTKSPKSRRSSISQTPEKQTTPQNPSESAEAEEPKAKQATRTSPRASLGKRFQVQDVLQEVAATPTSDDMAGKSQPSSKKHKCDDLPLPVPKRKRVSFGGQLDPELFDKRLPPNSPLRRGATPGRCSLGFTQKSLFRLRRASTIGLMGYQLEEDITESPAKNVSPKRVASPAKAPKAPSPAKAPKAPSPAKAPKAPSPAKAPKAPSPAKAPKAPSPAKAPKAPSPAKAPKAPSSSKQSSSPEAKTPSPKNSKTSTPSNQATPKSSKRLSNASVKLPSQSEESLLKTPMTRGRFSVSRISTPSPVSDFEKEVKEDSTPAVEKPQECVIPRATPRRSSMKASARKTPKSLLKSALKVVRSRRSGATRANLMVVSSWADIVKFGQAKPQMECCANKTANKKTAVKQTKVTKPKTPAHKLKDHTSTGHADSPASIVIGKAHLRSTRPVCAAPKLVCNVALFKMGMKMDEDLSGVSDIFKTPANSRRKSAFKKSNECPTPLGVGEMTETSVINTPEEAGEMVVSPMSVASTDKLGRYNSEAVTRLLQDNQDESLIEEMDESIGFSSSELCTVMSSESHAKDKKAVPVQTPQYKPTPPECLTGVKRLMRTPRQKSNPIEDLRGKLLQTPKEPKLPQEESLEGVAELFNTPKQKKTPSKKEPSRLKRLMNTPKVKNSPVLCAVALRRLSQTPKDVTEQQEDLTRVNRLMRTPRQKKQPVEEDLTGVQQMMKTPKQKNQPVEDLVGVKNLLQTPKEKSEPVENDFGIDNLMMTPKQKSDEEPDSVGPAVLPVEDPSVESEEGEKICPTEDVKNDTEEAVCLQVETKEAGHPEEVISHELMTNVDEDVQKAPLEMICTFDVISTTGETTPSVSSLTQEEQSNRSSPAIKSRRGAKVRFAQKSQTSQEHHVASDSRAAKVAGTDEETSADSAKSVPSVRGRRGKPAIELRENVVVQSPARKSNRGRNPKELVEAPKSSLASTEDERVTLKPRRGRKAEQEIKDSRVGPVADPKASAEVEVPMKSPAPVRVKRGRKGKYELANPQEPDASVDGVEVASESAELQPSAETETPVKTNTRARRGRTTKKEKIEEMLDIRSPDAVVEVVESVAENEASLKSTTKRGRSTRKEMLKTSQVEESSKPNPIGNTDFTTSDSKTLKSTEAQSAVETEDLVEVNVKPRRVRAIKKAIPVTAQVAETSKPTSDSKVLPEENPEMPLVKPSRGRRINLLALKNQAVVNEATVEALAVRCGRSARNKELKAQVEDAVNGQGTETVTTAALTKELVKKVRGSQKTKKLKAQVLDDSQEEDQDKPGTNSDSVPQMKAPTARSARGKRAVGVLAEPEAPVKRGRRAATVEIPPPIGKSSRGRKAAAKSEPEKVSTEVVEPIEVTSNETKVLESVRVKTPLAQADSEMVVKRGRITKKSKVTTKDISVSEVEDPQHNKKDKPAAKDPTVADIKQSAHPSVQKRKGRAAKKQEEPETDNPAAEENIQPVRRGRAATSVVSQLDVGTKRGQKRKNVKVAAEETPGTESLKRKRGKGACVETQPDVAVSFKRQKIAVKEPEETSIVGAEEDSKKEEKLVRGRRKPAQEDVSVPAEDPRLEVSTRRGTRGQKKAEADVPLAPARRTRRK